MKIELFTHYVDKAFRNLKLSFSLEEDIKHYFETNPFLNYFLLESDEQEIIGYLSFSLLYDKAEVNYIFIKEEYRKKGYAFNLMNELIEYCKDKNVENITLEVSKENSGALILYTKCGFKKVAIRKGYYAGVDAILMERKMM